MRLCSMLGVLLAVFLFHAKANAVHPTWSCQASDVGQPGFSVGRVRIDFRGGPDVTLRTWQTGTSGTWETVTSLLMSAQHIGTWIENATVCENDVRRVDEIWGQSYTRTITCEHAKAQLNFDLLNRRGYFHEKHLKTGEVHYLDFSRCVEAQF